MADQAISGKFGNRNSNWRGGFASICAQCGARVWVKPSRASRDRYFCSKPCSHRWHSANTRGAKTSGWKGGEVEHSCRVCGNVFNALPSKQRLYCSKACGSIAHTSCVSISCRQCGQSFSVQRHRGGKARYCSNHCAASSRDSGRTIARRRLDRLMMVTIWNVLRTEKPSVSLERRVGYRSNELKEHMESLFVPGMSWENVGLWHVDHRTPLSAFQYSSSDDPAFKECWALSNLQPLWARENMSKGARLEWRRPDAAEMSPRPA